METPSAALSPGIDNMQIKEEANRATDQLEEPASHAIKPEPTSTKSHSASPIKHDDTVSDVKPAQEVIGGEITLKTEPGKPPKLARKPSQKIVSKPPDLYSDWPDATKEATSVFDVIKDCTYANRNMGYTEPPLECDCSEEWDSTTQRNNACDEHSDCINRATKMECAGDCGCGSDCQNQRFTRKQWASVSVIKTDKKGFGLRADVDIGPHDFIFEYVGEVIGEGAFRKRTIAYDDQGIKHFYFMSLNKGEFIDATKKGNLGRFCNHSCNPNCYVDKWVVGEKLRMGIFAERAIKAGEELVFNYNVDRYGADPQPCYCGEPNCVGFIGGKTQSGKSASKLSAAVVEALGLDDADDWDDAIVKPIKKRKTEEDDSEYVSNVQPRELQEDGVTKVMAELSITKEKWIAVKLLGRIERADDERVRLRVIKFHGYRILNMVMKTFIEDDNLLKQVLGLLSKFPKITRNKIHDSGIEKTMAQLKESANDEVKAQATALLEAWSKLEMGFRIKKLKRDPAVIAEEKRLERLRLERERQDQAAEKAEKAAAAAAAARPSAPTGPKAMFRPPPVRSYRPTIGPLPKGWVEQRAPDGSIYYWNALGETTRRRPTAPAPPPPPPTNAAPKAASDREILQNLINKIVSEKKPEEATPTSATSKDDVKPKAGPREEKWKSFSEEKQKKLYENTLFPHVSYVMNKYKKYFARDALKKLGKTIAKKMVESDFKHGRIENPTAKLSKKREKAVKEHVKAFFDKAAKKQKEAKVNGTDKEHAGPTVDKPSKDGAPAKDDDADADIALSDNEVENENGTPHSALKRRREDGETGGSQELDEGATKKSRISMEDTSTPIDVDTSMIPPPPPPPLEGLENDLNDSEMRIDQQTPHTDPEVDVVNVKVNSNAPQDLSGLSGDEPTDSMQLATPPTTAGMNGVAGEDDSRMG